MSRLVSIFDLFNHPAFACAVCFGGKDQPGLIHGLIIGGVLLLASVFAILIALAKAVREMEAHKNAADAASLGTRHP